MKRSCAHDFFVFSEDPHPIERIISEELLNTAHVADLHVKVFCRSKIVIAKACLEEDRATPISSWNDLVDGWIARRRVALRVFITPKHHVAVLRSGLEFVVHKSDRLETDGPISHCDARLLVVWDVFSEFRFVFALDPNQL